MGMQEAGARSDTAELLELAVATGELVPDLRGWKQRQDELVRTHLTASRIDLGGRTLLDPIREERAKTWLEGRRSPARLRLLGPLVEIVRSPVALPDGVDDPIPPLRAAGRAA